MKTLIKNIQENLTPDLLKGRWRNQNHPLQGHCYVAAEALWHLLDKTIWRPVCASYVDSQGKATHWWLINIVTNEIADPTREQFSQPPYHLGRRTGFLTLQPSARTKKLLEKIRIGSSEAVATSC